MTDHLSSGQLRALLEFAVSIATGDMDAIQRATSAVLALEVSRVAADELVLQSVLTVGWPRTLVAAGIWRHAAGDPELMSAEPASLDIDTRVQRGERTCRAIYGLQYERLRRNVRTLHPALDEWMIADGYGRTLSRPGLALPVRELCTVAQTVVLQTSAQLHSHLRGALRAGATIDQVDVAVSIGVTVLDVDRQAAPRALWHRVRSAWKGTP